MYFGGDPEFFLLKEGEVIPAHLAGVPPKEDAWDLGYGKVFRDGFAVEFTPNPETCRAMFTNGMASMVQQTLARVNNVPISTVQKMLPLTYTLLPIPLAEWDMEEFISIMKEAPKDLKVFGCSPSYNTYLNGGSYRIPVDPMEWPFRTTGGHIHMDLLRGGYYGEERANFVTQDVEDALKKAESLKARRLLGGIVSVCDVMMGLPSVFLFPELSDMQRMRRQVYGRAGEFRLQRYERAGSAWDKEKKKFISFGLEYRTLGPEVYSNAYTLGYFLGLAKSIMTYWDRNYDDLLPKLSKYAERIEKAINNADVDEAWKLYALLAPRRVYIGHDYDTGYVDVATTSLLEALKDAPKLRKEFSSWDLPSQTKDAHDGWGNWISKHYTLSQHIREEDEIEEDDIEIEEEEIA